MLLPKSLATKIWYIAMDIFVAESTRFAMTIFIAKAIYGHEVISYIWKRFSNDIVSLLKLFFVTKPLWKIFVAIYQILVTKGLGSKKYVFSDEYFNRKKIVLLITNCFIENKYNGTLF